MKTWPNVPACRGWLGLDARGEWYMRDEPTQAAGRFPQSRGSRVEHVALRGFIERNYLLDDDGAAYFQNGPQKVFVTLEAAPWILGVQRRDDGTFEVRSHTGAAWPTIEAAWEDEHGRLFLAGPDGLGLVRSTDMAAAADAVEAGLWQPQETTFETLLRRYRVQLDPQPL